MLTPVQLGFTVGDINLDDFYLRRLAVNLKISVVNVGYRYVLPSTIYSSIHCTPQTAPRAYLPEPSQRCLRGAEMGTYCTPIRTILKPTYPQVAENTSSLKADLSKGFILIGDSAGANLAAVLAHEARDDPFFNGRRPTGQFLREPWLAHPDGYPERCVRTPRGNQWTHR